MIAAWGRRGVPPGQPAAEAGTHFDVPAALFDASTFRHFDRVGIDAGWRCREVGAGGPSVAAWLGERVGPGGRVLATDIDVSWAGTAATGGARCSATTSPATSPRPDPSTAPRPSRPGPRGRARCRAAHHGPGAAPRRVADGRGRRPRAPAADPLRASLTPGPFPSPRSRCRRSRVPVPRRWHSGRRPPCGTAPPA